MKPPIQAPEPGRITPHKGGRKPDFSVAPRRLRVGKTRGNPLGIAAARLRRILAQSVENACTAI